MSVDAPSRREIVPAARETMFGCARVAAGAGRGSDRNALVG
jgi:hypothetical protein